MDLVFVTLIAAAAWFWWAATHSRELAVGYARAACRRCQVQLLDETVSLNKLRLRRNTKGHITFYRRYRFEFSTMGDDRRSGVVTMLGSKLADMHLDLDIEELSG